ncbi:MAG: LytTR family transcriptional regulator DNA-binding domain-containing protein [Clostridia bacterium]|nr:LytTR family transcriptional regulator DNA-binding domain-containing protein [Clostridia bacterium]
MTVQNTIYVKARQTFFAVRLDTIAFMEQECRQITIHLTGGQNICFYGEYDRMMPWLDDRFVHPHQSYVINMQQIHRLGKNEALLFSGDTIEMGNSCFARLRKAYREYITENIHSRPDILAGDRMKRKK